MKSSFGTHAIFPVLLIVLVRGASGWDRSFNEVDFIVPTQSGPVKGTAVQFRGNTVYQFLGIPYAEPPIGVQRFRRPIPAKKWSQVLDATHLGASCMQPHSTLLPQKKMNEDCLFLNIFTSRISEKNSPKAGHLLPVLFWIHGGGFSFGSAADRDELYDGTALVVFENVVVVTINYRLTSFGFLNLDDIEPSIKGNQGLWDQNLALKWTKSNIHLFGGDPDRITIFGESAGAMSVAAHILSPVSRGLFRNAIMQSGSLLDMERWVQPQLRENLLAKTGCWTEGEDSGNVLTCLQMVDSQTILNSSLIGFWPISGDEFLPLSPEVAIARGQFARNVNLLLGAVKDEGTFMVGSQNFKAFHPVHPSQLNLDQARVILGGILGENSVDYFFKKYLTSNRENLGSQEIREAIARAVGDVILFCPTYIFGYEMIRKPKRNQTNGKIFAYYLTQKPSVSFLEPCTTSSWYGTCHGDDLPFIFGLPLRRTEEFTREDVILSLNMMNVWAEFARTGLPPKQGSMEWPEMVNDTKDLDQSTELLRAMVFDSQRIGHIETDRLEFCRKNWPFPLERFYPLQHEIKPRDHLHTDEF